MPRTVRLSTGEVVVDVPDDVTDEEVEAKAQKRAERPEPVEQPEP